MGKLKPIIALVCDDFRKESSGKGIMVGVYQRYMMVGKNNLPKDPNEEAFNDATVILYATADKAGKYPFKMKVLRPHDKLAIEGDLSIIINEKSVEPNHTSAVISDVPIPVNIEGSIEIHVRPTDDENWTLVKTLEIQHQSEDEAE